MNKLLNKILAALTILSVPIISSCNKNNITEDVLFNENYQNLEKLRKIKSDQKISYDSVLFGEFEDIKYYEAYFNNKLNNEMVGASAITDDTKYLYYNKDTVRMVNLSDGYQLDLKTKTTMNVDFSISNYRSKIYNEETTLTVTKEFGKNPYSSWKTYKDDWITRYLDSKHYLSKNNLEFTQDVISENENILEDYFVSIYSIKINNPGAIRKNYYNIGILRKKTDMLGKNFYLFVMKSTSNKNDEFKSVIQSFKTITATDNGKNQLLDLPLKANPNWNEQTKNYFTKLTTQQRTDWGIYTYGIKDGSNDNPLKSKQGALEEAMDYEFDILPTYMHISTNNSQTFFPLNQAKQYAGGNGYNGKKILQYSYQFTSTNNGVSADVAAECYTPMFDILRGKDDDYDYFDIKDRTHNTLEELAKTIKKYEAPVLFRLNNEMNTDWTSYCGMMTLLDPDIFQATWRYLYNLFEKYGVDNCIWIFNPVAHTTPYSNWGEDLCYFPGVDYVQALGLTYYYDNNNDRNKADAYTFRNNYTELYNHYKDTWINYPWIISEFACGAGGNTSGERFRNQTSQAAYVKGMFADFNDRENHPYLQNIKGAVWFSTNDFSSGGVSNQYDLDIESLPLTIAEFKEGLKSNRL